MPTRSLASSYKKEPEDLRPFYAAWPSDLLKGPPPTGACWPGLCEELEAYQQRIGNVPPSWGDCFVVTGQQPALFTGPLYTIYKIATAIRLARRITEKFGTNCTPVFWQGSDDHDFEEARTAHILGKNHAPLSITYDPSQNIAGLPMYRVPLEPSLHDLIDRAAEAATGSEFSDVVRAYLHESLDASSSLADWNARIIAKLFAGEGLAIFTSECSSARLAARDVLAEEIQHPLRSARLINDAGEALEALHYARQIEKDAADCSFFLERHSRRCKVTFQNGLFEVGADGQRVAQDEMLELLATEPERFSPNVALRCIVQQRLFPAAAYVAGPGEVGYWGQFKPLFQRYKLGMPVVYPRAECILTTPKINKLRAKLGFDRGPAIDWSVPDLLLDRALRVAAANPMLDAFHKHRSRIADELRELAGELHKAPVAVSSLTDRINEAMDGYERMLLRADEARLETVRQQVARLCNVFAPFRKPQERVYTVFSFLFEHGWDLVPRIVREIDIESFETQEIEL